MKDGFIKAASCTPDIVVADVSHNRVSIAQRAREAAGAGAKIIVFPELCMCGYTCSDLFWQKAMLDACVSELLALVNDTKDLDALIFVGLPFEYGFKLYNVAAALCRGRVVGIVPMTHLPTYNEYYEARHFTPGPREARTVKLG